MLHNLDKLISVLKWYLHIASTKGNTFKQIDMFVGFCLAEFDEIFLKI